MANKQLGVGVEIWVVQRATRGRQYVDGPFRVVAFDQEMVYVVRGVNKSYGEFFPVDEVVLNREAAEKSLERSKAGQRGVNEMPKREETENGQK